MTNKNLFLTIVLLTVFIGTSLLALFTAKKVTQITPYTSTNDPDFYMIQAIYTKFNHEGLIQNSIKTDKITHFDKNNIYLFEKPSMIIYNTNEKPWRITAHKGKSEQGKARVDLWDNVKIVKAPSINTPNFDITTSMLTIYPDIKFAETKQQITIIQNDNIVKAIGAKADFKTGIVKLISKIQARYYIQ